MSQTNAKDRIELLRSQVHCNPNDGAAWLNLARALAKGPPGKELFHAIEQSIVSRPGDQQVWLLAVNVQQRLRGQDAALKWLEHTASQNPTLVAPQLVIASLKANGDPDGAIARCEQVIDRHTGSDPAAVRQARSIRADCFRQGGHWQKALNDYRVLESVTGKDPRLQNNIGCCLAGLEQFDEAAGYFTRALKLHPEFTEAKLNEGLLFATRLQEKEALEVLENALADTALDEMTRQTTESICSVLREHIRLKPSVSSMLQTGSVKDLAAAIGSTPVSLLEPDPDSLETLWSLVRLCRDLQFDTARLAAPVDSPHIAFAEAWAQCKMEGGAVAAIEFLRNYGDGRDEAALPRGHRGIGNYLDLVEDRKAFGFDGLRGQEAEARLRYWHARLLALTPEKMPGQFKAIPNTIGQIRLTPPQNVVGTFRALFSEMRPMLTDPWPRAVFMYIAFNGIHGFADGNGRLSRFFLCAEAEAACLPAIVIPLHMRTDVAAAINIAWTEGRLEPLLELLIKAHNDTNRFLKELESTDRERS